MDETADQFIHAIGSFAEGQTWLHKKSVPSLGAYPVGDVCIAQYCSITEDANPSFWDEALATELWGSRIAPPGSIQLWVKAPPWQPAMPVPEKPLFLAVPLPGKSVINVTTDIEYFRPIHQGDRISVYHEVMDISPAKTTRLGTGHFLTTLARYHTETGEPVAQATNILFRFDPHAAAS